MPKTTSNTFQKILSSGILSSGDSSNSQMIKTYEDVFEILKMDDFFTIENFKKHGEEFNKDLNSMAVNTLRTFDFTNKNNLTLLINYLLPKILVDKIKVYNNQIYLLKNYWTPISNIQNFKTLFSQMISYLTTGRVLVKEILKILTPILEYLTLTEITNSVIQLENCYITEFGEIKDGLYLRELPRFTIKRPYYKEKILEKPIYSLDLLNHLCGDDEQSVDFLIDHLATMFLTHQSIKQQIGQMIRLYGPKGENGKSTLLNKLTRIFGKKNIVSTSLTDFSSPKNYDLADAARSLLVFDADMPESYFDDKTSQIVKKLVTGDVLRVREIYGRPMTVVPSTTILTASNFPFKASDKSDAMTRRIVEIQTNDKLIRSDEWFQGLNSYEDDDRLFHLLINRMQELLVDYSGTIKARKLPEKVLNQRKRLQDENNNVLEFINEVMQNGEYIIGHSVKEVREQYEEYCKENILNPLGVTKYNYTIETQLGLERKLVHITKVKGCYEDVAALSPSKKVRAWVKK